MDIKDSEPEKPTCDDNKDNDEPPNVRDLLLQIKELKLESQQFSVQRAKMKELFVVKEEEERKLRKENEELQRRLDDAMCQIAVAGMELDSERTKNHQAIHTLQMLLNETLEESAARNEELKTVRARLAEEAAREERPLLSAPGAVLSTLAKKVASQLGAADVQSSANDSLEESMRKAKEDTEVLRSILVPLEEEIAALKNKLRETDTELMRYKQREALQNTHSTSGVDQLDGAEVSKTAATTFSCEMCSNYERQLVAADTKSKALERELATLDRVKEELSKEMAFRKQMEDKWNEKKDQHKTQMEALELRLKNAEGRLDHVQSMFKETCAGLMKKFEVLSKERRVTEDRLNQLQEENDILVGKHSANSQDLQQLSINLPNDVQELQEMWLHQYEELIKARVGLERNQEQVETYLLHYTQLREKYQEAEKTVRQVREEFILRNNTIEEQEKQLKGMSLLKEELIRLKDELGKAHGETNHLKDQNSELRNRLAYLQTGLENGEAVQMDFVRLSQNLQKELEHLRVQNNSLRWEFEEDVSECRGCEQPFKPHDRAKGNCRHCGRVFCGSCLSHRFTASGPSKREARVCTVCHTLLDQNTPPYFSTEAPK